MKWKAYLIKIFRPHCDIEMITLGVYPTFQAAADKLVQYQASKGDVFKNEWLFIRNNAWSCSYEGIEYIILEYTKEESTDDN